MLGEETSEVPSRSETALRQWLSGRNLGLVESEPREGFQWPGHFLARRRACGMWCVLFGAPPGVVFDPASPGGSFDSIPETFDFLFFLTPYDLGFERGAKVSSSGVVEMVAVAEAAEAPMREVEFAEAMAGRGLRGDRYADGDGTFSDPTGRGYDLTLVEAEALEELARGDVRLAPADARRNLVVRGVDLDDFIGERFTVGGVECFGQRRCEPCAHLERLTKPGVLRGLVHRGGLRADILTDGEIRPGDKIQKA